MEQETAASIAPESFSSSGPTLKTTPTLDDLEKFQIGVGINPLSRDPNYSSFFRSAPHQGIYSEIMSGCKWRNIEYYFYSILISTCFLLQIVIAATLTALGASSSSHEIITIFGATNTALAGILAIMKGQGLPDRVRKDREELRKVRDYIEVMEKSLKAGLNFEAPNTAVEKGLITAIEMYEKALVTAENNRPETYIASHTKDNSNGEVASKGKTL
jgi:hypothetical protein